MSIDYHAIGQRIKKVRNDQEYKQTELAELTDMSATNMSHVERGTTKLSLKFLVNISEALGVSLDYLVFGTRSHVDAVVESQIMTLLSSCTNDEKAYVLESITFMLQAFRKYRA